LFSEGLLYSVSADEDQQFHNGVVHLNEEEPQELDIREYNVDFCC